MRRNTLSQSSFRTYGIPHSGASIQRCRQHQSISCAKLFLIGLAHLQKGLLLTRTTDGWTFSSVCRTLRAVNGRPLAGCFLLRNRCPRHGARQGEWRRSHSVDTSVPRLAFGRLAFPLSQLLRTHHPTCGI